jgi:hypothetical protein
MRVRFPLQRFQSDLHPGVILMILAVLVAASPWLLMWLLPPDW